MKCIWEECEKKAEYIYLGKSLCQEHFEKCKELFKEKMMPENLFPKSEGLKEQIEGK